VLHQPKATVLAQQPALPSGQDRLASARRRYAQGDYRGAVAEFAADTSTWWLSPELVDLAVHAAANAGQTEQALAWCNRALSVARESPDLHFLQATVWIEAGKPELARKALRRVLYLAPGFPLAHLVLGQLDQAQGRHAQAQASYRRAAASLDQFAATDLVPQGDGLSVADLRQQLHHLSEALPTHA